MGTKPQTQQWLLTRGKHEPVEPRNGGRGAFCSIKASPQEMVALFIIINLGISRLGAVRGEAWMGTGVHRGKPKEYDGLRQNALFLN